MIYNDNLDFDQWLYANWWKQKTGQMFYNVETQEEMTYDDLYKLYKKHQPKVIYFNLYKTESEGYYIRNVYDNELEANFEAAGVDAFIKTITLTV